MPLLSRARRYAGVALQRNTGSEKQPVGEDLTDGHGESLNVEQSGRCHCLRDRQRPADQEQQEPHLEEESKEPNKLAHATNDQEQMKAY